MDDLITNFTDYHKTKFSNELNLEKFIASLQYSYRWVKENMTCFRIENHDEHVLIMMESENSSWAYFGYLKLKSETSTKIWAKVVSFCKSKQINKLLGPIQGSTYFPYQCINKKYTCFKYVTKGHIISRFFVCYLVEQCICSKL